MRVDTPLCSWGAQLAGSLFNTKLRLGGVSVPKALCAISSNSKIALLLMSQPGGAAQQCFAGAVSGGETHGHGCGCHGRD